jgi:UDP-2-acetamido-3-amino-2,3-dideoxy-glucuronate N-acetyltransferase
LSNKLEKVECEGGYYYKHPTSVIDEGAIIGPNTKLWAETYIQAEAKVGANCILGAGVHIESEAELGDYGKIQRGVVLYKGVKAGDYVFFGPNATTTNDRNPRAFGSWDLAETRIGIGASIGANATLIAGNEIGPLALIGAGSVVTRPVGACQAVAGNPSRFIGWVDAAGNIIDRNEDAPDDIQELIADPLTAIVNYLGLKEGK